VTYNYDQVIKILMKESKEIKMMKEITYLEVEVKRLPSINQNSFSVMVKIGRKQVTSAWTEKC
jgi:hypothetical protein